VIDCNEWRTEKQHECANMGKVKDSNYDGNCTARHFWIFVDTSVQTLLDGIP